MNRVRDAADYLNCVRQVCVFCGYFTDRHSGCVTQSGVLFFLPVSQTRIAQTGKTKADFVFPPGA